MSSKRALYKPSPQTHVGQKAKSCLLAQGRLVTDISLKPAPQQAVRSTSDGDGTGVVHKQDTAGTPRKHAPQHLETHSPKPRPPVDNLDLSDSDIDFPHHSMLQSPADRSRLRRTEVLVMDASRQTTEPASTEVEVLLGYEQSPVRVVCHSAGRNTSQFRASSEGLDKWTVHVDGVPKVSFLESSEPSQLGVRAHEHSKEHITGQEDEHSRTKPSSHRKEHIKTGREIHVDTGRPHLTHYPQPNFDDSNGSSTSERIHDNNSHPAVDVDDVNSVTSESDACSLQDFVTQSKPRIVSKQKKPVSAKKKPGRFVSSRYLQSAQSQKDTSLLPDKSTLSVKNMNQNYSGPIQGIERLGSKKDSSLPHRVSAARTKELSHAGHRGSERPASARKKKPTPGEERPETPVLTSQKSKSQKTSTPTHDVSSVLLHDASAIQSEMSILATGDASHSRLHNKGSAQKVEKKKSEFPVSKRTLQLLYARYLQSLFLDVQAKKIFKIHEKQEMGEMQALWESVEEKRKQELELRKEITRLKHNILLDEQLELQEAGLDPIVSNLPRVGHEHKSLADSLDTTRHQIKTKGIYNPDDDDQYQAMFESALLESEQLLGELSVMTRSATPHIADTATALQATETTLKAECKEITRCKELVSAIQTLSTEENSLKIHSMQRLIQ